MNTTPETQNLEEQPKIDVSESQTQMNETQMEDQKVDEEKSESKILVYSIIGILVVLLGIAGYLFFQNNNSKTVIETSPTETSEVAMMEKDETFDLRTYSNDEFGFSFSYPSDWQASCENPQDDTWLDATICDLRAPNTLIDHGHLMSGAYMTISISKPNPNYSNLSEYVSFSTAQGKYQTTKFTRNSIEGYQINSENGNSFVFENNGDFISISWISADENNTYDSSIEQILSSFMLEESTTPLVKSCEHKGLGISLNIPKNWNCNNVENEQFTLNITSDIFTVTISTLGRGTYCEPPVRDPNSPRYDPDSPDEVCKISSFYKNGITDLDLYKSYGENKEILGFISLANSHPYMSITWEGMKTDNLTLSQEKEIKSIVDSIRPI